MITDQEGIMNDNELAEQVEKRRDLQLRAIDIFLDEVTGYHINTDQIDWSMRYQSSKHHNIKKWLEYVREYVETTKVPIASTYEPFLKLLRDEFEAIKAKVRD